jgi:sugar lactone lactonase YvrE
MLLALPAGASAYTTAPGYAASDYAAGFPESTANDWGPIGIAFDTSDNLYVADTADGNIYRFEPGGGTASAATRLTPTPIPGKIAGLAVSGDGNVYLARYGAGDVVQVDPGSGQVIRTVASVRCATGLAIDPASGDLFVSENGCGSTIFRVSDFSSAPGTVRPYTNAPGVDGLAFDNASGDLYAESDGHVLRIDGTRSLTHGHVDSVAKVPHADGLAFGAHSSGQAPYLVANRNDGIVTRVGFGLGIVPSMTNIFTGGSRGDFAAVDSNGCLYITQSASIVRIGRGGQACGLEPTNPGLSPRVALSISAGARPKRGGAGVKACVRIGSLRLRVSQRGRVRLRSATVYVNGRRVRQLHGSGVTAPFTLSKLPRSSFTVKIVAVTTSGKRLVSSKHYGNCAKPPTRKCTARLTVQVAQRHGARAVRVDEWLNGRHSHTVRGRAVKRVTLSHPPHGRFTLKLVTRYTRGKRATTRRTFPACSR